MSLPNENSCMCPERVALLLGLVVVLAGGVGGAVAVGLDAGGSAQPGEATNVTVDTSVQESNGSVGVLVALSEHEGKTDVAALQAHASESQQPLLAFAEATDGVTVERQFWLTNAVLVTVDTGTVSLDALAAVEGVEALAENARVSLAPGDTERATPAGVADSAREAGPDPRSAVDTRSPQTGDFSLDQQAVAPTTSTQSYDATYGLEQINATTVWAEYGTQGEGTSVAVLDTGVDPDHPDIDAAKWAEFDGDGNELDTSPNDEDGHGTHVSGTVTGGNASGEYIGVAPAADLYAVKVLNDTGSGTIAQAVAGMEWAVEENADIISMSLGAKGYLSGFIDPVRNAEDAGTTVVASAGNTGENTSSSPGNVYDAISVGASDESADIAPFSSGEEIDTVSDWGADAPADWPLNYVVPSVAAPGTFVTSAQTGGGHEQRSGTSMAAPHVSGAIALLESVVTEELTPDEFETALEETARKPDDWSEPEGERDTRYGSGIVDVAAAAESLPTPEAASFQVDAVTTNGPVEEGVPLEVTATVENTGDVAGNQSVTLDAGGLGTNASTVSLNGTESTGVTLSLATDAGDAGEYTATVTTENDTASVNVTVLEPAFFAVEILDVEEPVEGETLTVTAGVENTGDTEDSESVSLDVPGLGGDTANVTLGGNESTTETLSVGTETGDAGEYTATVGTEDDNASTNVTVALSSGFSVSIVDSTAAVEGENLTVTVAVENVGDQERTQTVTLDVPGLGNNSVSVTLGGGESTEETLTVDTELRDAGEYTATVASENQTVELTVAVVLPSMPDAEDRPQDLNGDDRYEDVDGDGTFDIFDVQRFFTSFATPAVQDHAWAYDFDGDDDVTVLDVQALFETIS
jgi:subtilisin family serine protease